MSENIRKKTFWEGMTEPSWYEIDYKLGKYDELRGKAIWHRHCGQRMRVLIPYALDGQGRVYPLVKRYYCKVCHIATSVELM